MKLKNAKIKILDLDLRGCLYLNNFSHSQRVALFFKIISRVGDGPFWYLMLAIVWGMQGITYSLQIIYLLLGGSVGTAIYKFLKHKTTRPRPYQVHQVIVLGERPLDHFSFPSGHTLHAVSFSIVMAAYYPRMALALVPFTLMVAISRIVLGLHYPSDVLAGAGLGMLIGGLSVWLF